jgi:predicted esterase
MLESYPRRKKMSNKLMSAYDIGKSADFSCQYDQRFSYSTYVPKNVAQTSDKRNKLLVVIHGSGRNNQLIRDRFISFADRFGYILLSPLFPCGILDNEDRDSYKYFMTDKVQYDKVLLAMIDEISARLHLEIDDYLMFGFSGGAHFAHRFFYLHPNKLSHLIIASPGSVTLIDTDQDWWVGLRDIEERFNIEFNIESLKKPKIQLLVGGEDLSTREITHSPGGQYWMENANQAGITRVDRCNALYENFKKHELNVGIEVIPDTAHDGDVICNKAIEVFSKFIEESDIN